MFNYKCSEVHARKASSSTSVKLFLTKIRRTGRSDAKNFMKKENI